MRLINRKFCGLLTAKHYFKLFSQDSRDAIYHLGEKLSEITTKEVLEISRPNSAWESRATQKIS